MNCATGASLTQVGANAASKDTVLQALGQAASELRGKLGESLASIQKYDAPLPQVTTTSLEALKTLSLGVKAVDEKGSAAAIPYFKRATELDPNFAQAWLLTGIFYGNLGESSQASEYTKRAYALRERVTERERLHIEVFNSLNVTGDQVKAEEAAELLKRTYPRFEAGYDDAAFFKLSRGDYQNSITDSQQALQIDRSDSLVVTNLCVAYTALNRFDDAKAVLDQGLANGVDPSALASSYYLLAFLRNDRDTMEKQVALVTGKAGYEDALFSTQADTEAYYGRLKQAREYSRCAAESARLNGTTEVAAGWVLNGASREAEFGNTAEARRDADSALRLSPGGRYTRSLAALAMARAGDASQVQKIADTLLREFPGIQT